MFGRKGENVCSVDNQDYSRKKLAADLEIAKMVEDQRICNDAIPHRQKECAKPPKGK